MMELLTALEGSAFAIWLREAPTVWAYPTILTLHTVGLAVLVGTNAAVDLRVLGFGRQIALAPMERFFPAMWIGFWINAISGVMLFTVDPTTKGIATVFLIKLAFIAAGVMLMVLLRRALYGPGRDLAIVTSAAKTFAALSLLAWAAAIVAGRLQAYVL
jgi:hypothetical protein